MDINQGAITMGAARKIKHLESDDDSIFDDTAALIALAQRSFNKAAKAEVAKNDRLGIPTHGAVGGQLAVRQPPERSVHPI
ncbi:MAG: hypothetical protein HQL97_05715 [Magnetococcales bacterium]|nr:hypothetical protein [Magnetococcales bacterium]